MPERLKAIGFWSYARDDERASTDNLTDNRCGLRRTVLDEVKQFYGRSEVTILQHAAAKGNIAAMSNLAALPETGKGANKDVARAKALYERAAIGGEPGAREALRRLGGVR